MPAKKIACLGGGSMYFARALPDLATVPGLAGSEVVLYDLDQLKAEVMARHGTSFAQRGGHGLQVRTSTTLEEALDGADFVITSIGGSGASVGGVYGTGYHMQDVLIPAKYGIYQIVGDTGGPAGMMMGLRSIPTYVDICQKMEELCPDAILFNHSNPMAPLCRAMVKYSDINVVGICHGVQIGIVDLAKFLNVDPHDLETTWIGTNHYHWFTSIRYQGQDIYDEVRRKLDDAPYREGGEMCRRLSVAYGHEIVYQYDDHVVEFYPYMAQLPNGDNLPYGQKHWLGEHGYNTPIESRQPSEEERRAQHDRDLAEMEERLHRIQVPETASDPLTGEGLGRLIEAISLGKREVFIVNIPNEGMVPNLPDYGIIEVEAVTDSTGVRGIMSDPAPVSLMGLLSKRIAWQELVADAAVMGDRNLALQAILLDELTIRPELAEKMLDELLEASRPMLPAFFG